MKGRFILIVAMLALCPIAWADCPPGDLNRDCRVNGADLLLFSRDWLAGMESDANLNRAGSVDAHDLALFANEWQQTGCPIVINEILAHAHAEASDWVELHNVSSVPVDIGGWFLSDNPNDLQRYRIADGTIMEPNSYFVLYETIHFANPFDPGMIVPFAFTENGEGVYLSSGDDPCRPEYLVSEEFGASATSYSFGRYLTSAGDCHFVTMADLTPGRANSYPLVGPIVIDEIMYHPQGDADAEYVELLNISKEPVTLFDFSCNEPWRLTDDSGIDYRFPTDAPVTLDPGRHVLLVRDPIAMQQYFVPADATVFDWGSGKLANQGETLRLIKPGDVDDRGVRYWIEVDRVTYSDGSHPETFKHGIDPWPVEADGRGLSLNRLFPSRYGNDPNNWHATIPTPGAVND
ncbi:MAG: hypothetical protein GX448_20600 [Planctomycetes bacterium]|nr:hypothetical protein [Planctomycetota bacterium]